MIDFAARVHGMLYGSAIGDAVGAPLEFVEPPLGHAHWRHGEQLTTSHIEKLTSRFQMRRSQREAEPFGYWLKDAPLGSITDDTRFKLLFIQALDREKVITGMAIARAILSFEDGAYEVLAQEWLSEFREAAKWALNQGGLPPDRMWGGIESLAGQLIFLPLAALHPGRPEAAYLHAWSANIFDTGVAKDINSAVVAGLSVALAGGDWAEIRSHMLRVDPYKFGQAVYGERPLAKWIDNAESWVSTSQRQPRKLFELLETRLEAQVWWEAWVPVVIMFASLQMVDYHPVAAMQLALEFGHDTDSYLQLMGAFIGAMYGPDVFPASMREQVNTQLEQQYDTSLDTWSQRLIQCQGRQSEA
ncbi:MAG: ADP-ribosylglycohydrolase family protein [Bacteroidota bacterium]